MSDGRQIVRNSGFLALARIAERVSGLVLTVLIARHLGAASLGIYSAALAYFGLLAPAGELGVVTLLVREIARGRERTNAYLVHAATLAIVASAAAIVIFMVIIRRLEFDKELTVALSIIALALVPGTLNSIQEAIFIAHQRVYFQTWVTTGAAVVNLAGGLYLVESGHGVVSLFALFVGIEYTVAIVYFVLIGMRVSRIRWEWDPIFARSMLRDIRPFAGTSIVAALFSRPEIIMLSIFSNATQVGYYSAAFKIAALWNDVTQVLMANVFPVLSRLYAESRERFNLVWKSVLRSLLAVAIPAAVGGVVIAQSLIEALYGTKFEPAITPMRLLALTMPLVSAQAVFWRVLSARSQQGVVFRVQIFSVVVRIAISYPLIVSFGATGAAIGAVIAFALHTAALGVFVRRGGVPIDLVRLTWPFAVASLAMGAIAWVVLAHADLWVTIPTAILSYGLLLLAFGFRATDLVEFSSPSLRPRR